MSDLFHRRSISSSLSLTSRTSRRKLNDLEFGGTYWKSKYQHLVFFLGYCINWRSLSSLIYEDGYTNPKYVPNVIQTIVISIIIGGPLIFLQHFVGQFSSKGCIAIGSMLPVLYGFGYCMIALSVVDCIQTLYYSGGSLVYIMTSLVNYPTPSWMLCSADFYDKFPNCFSIQDIDLCMACYTSSNESCFPPNSKTLSAKIFRYLVAFEEDINVMDIATDSTPRLKPSCHIFVTIMFVYFMSCRRLTSLDWSLRLSLIFCLLATGISWVIVFFQSGVHKSLELAFAMDIHPFLEVMTWVASFRRVTEALKISYGGNVLFGSYMPMDTPSHFRVCFLIGFFTVFVIINHFHFYFFDGFLACKLNMREYGVNSANSITFELYPTVIGLTATPQLWSVLYFTTYWILSVISIVMNIIVMDEALGEELKLSDYYMYTRCVICFIIFLLTLPLTSLAGYRIAKVIAHELKIMNLLVIFIIFLIVFMYNIQRFKDDIHFVLHVPPTWYVQTCWVVIPFVSGVSFVYQIWQYRSDNQFYIVRLPLFLFVGFPILLGFFVKLVHYVKKRNITGIFRPSVTYGPPDFEMRMLRLLYNPRLEVRYMRRMEICKHRCLLNNEIAIKVIEKEMTLLDQMAYDLETNLDTREQYQDIIDELRNQYQVLNVRYFSLLEQLRTKSVSGR